LILGLTMASRKIFISCALYSHHAQINVNCMSKLHDAIIFCVGISFLSINGI
jgi:hypothetical protein